MPLSDSLKYPRASLGNSYTLKYCIQQLYTENTNLQIPYIIIMACTIMYAVRLISKLHNYILCTIYTKYSHHMFVWHHHTECTEVLFTPLYFWPVLIINELFYPLGGNFYLLCNLFAVDLILVPIAARTEFIQRSTNKMKGVQIVRV